MRSSSLRLSLLMPAIILTTSLNAQLEIRVRTPPPPLRVEVIPAAPSPSHYWIGGHWTWAHGRYVWNRGHWAGSRRGEVWVRVHWARVGDDWVFRPGRWRPIVAPREFVEVVTETAPPAPRVEVLTAPPSADHFWVPGHWRWDGRAHVWAGGHWELHRSGEVWAPGHWFHEGGRWRFYGGHWQAY